MRQRLTPALGLTLLVTALFVVLPARPVAACSCGGLPEEELVEMADAVFTARLLDRRDPDNSGFSSSGDWATLRFEVDAVYKGDVAIDQAVVTEQFGASCGLEIQGGGPFLVFARESHYRRQIPDDMVYAGLCDGTRPLGAAPVPASLGTARQPSAPTDGGQPATSAPSLSEDDDAYLFFIGGLVAAIVAVGGTIVFFSRRRASPTSA